jgi:hypothetical protein
MAEIKTCTICAIGGLELEKELETVTGFAETETPLQKELLRHLTLLSHHLGVISACGVPVEKAQNYLDSAVEAAVDRSWESVRRNIDSFQDELYSR